MWLSALSSQLSAAEITDALLDAVAAVESGNRNVPGDRGRAAGIYQLHAAACRDVRIRNAECGMRNPWVPEQAREIARAYLSDLNARLAVVLKRDPTAGELYAAYNCGWDGFERRGFRLARCPRATRESAARIEALILDARFRQLAAAGYALAIARPEEE